MTLALTSLPRAASDESDPFYATRIFLTAIVYAYIIFDQPLIPYNAIVHLPSGRIDLRFDLYEIINPVLWAQNNFRSGGSAIMYIAKGSRSF